MSTRRLLICAGALIACMLPLLAASGAQPTTDPFMGDWQGTVRTPDGKTTPLCAQVICWGKGEYQANLLSAFDQRIEPLAVWHGKLDGDRVAFGDTGHIDDGAFSGTLAGKVSGSFTMKHVVRLSPTLGAAPPQGAVVLFDGRDFDEWELQGSKPWIVDLRKAVGGDNRVAYLRARVFSPAAQPAMLEIGSDDGVKAWLNGAVVDANNASRPLTPWQDKVEINLVKSWNSLLLKIVQGAGEWSACARIRGRDGKDLDGLKFEPATQLAAGTDLRALQGESAGTILTWELAGPYMEEGKPGPKLFDTVFAPEQGDAGVEWRVVNDKPAPARQWKLLPGGIMEVTPGAGSMVSKRYFTDYRLHVEFRTPFMPMARGQGRGNSGVYNQGRYEIQVLDSYGLEGKDNECGAMYHLSAPRVNMCAPPLQWQTYDVEFHAARYNEKTKQVDPARITVDHNGVRVQDNVSLPSPNSEKPGFVGTGPILLQDHFNAVQYRNIWVLELSGSSAGATGTGPN